MRVVMFGAALLACAASAGARQVAPAPATPVQTAPTQATMDPTDPSAPAGQSSTLEAPAQTPDLTEAEQKTLKRCQAMGPGQAAQSSKCSAVMTKAGQGDPSKARAPMANQSPR